MSMTKRKVLAMDEDLKREELALRRRHRLLVELLDQLDAKHGAVDEALVAKYAGLLGAW
jgi:hypothetical protein